MRRLTLLAVAMATAFAFTVPVAAGSPVVDQAFQVSAEMAPYIVVMTDEPVVAYDGGIAGLPPTKPDKGEKVNPNSAAVKKYLKHLDKKRDEANTDAGIEPSQVVNTYGFALAGFSALLTPAQAEKLRTQKGVAMVVRDELRQLQTDRSPSFLGLTDAGGAYESGFTGEGVIVGVIDTGIWPEHPSFADDGSFPDPGVTLPCELGNPGYNPDDVDFDCNNKLIGARDMRDLYKTFIGPELYDSARDADGHGSHTTSTAAGNAGVSAEIFGIPRGTISGLAPRAQVVAYKGCGDQGCFGGDLADAIDQAVADGVDVINYSIGSTTPGLDGPDDIAFLFAANAGVFVATSAGNSGPGASTVGSPASVPWVTSVGASHHDRMFQGSVILGNGSQYFGASVTSGLGKAGLVDAADLKNEFCDPDVKFKPKPKGQIVLCKGAVERAAKSRAVMEQGGVGVVVYNDAPHQTLPSDNHYLPALHVTNADGLAIKAYIASTKPGNGPGKGKKAEATLNGGVAVDRAGSFMAYFSSRGPVGSPASADIIKPDVTAPGVQILAANSPAEGFDAPGQLFQAIQGTSMSSPHVAGLFALLKQAHPDWSPAEAKSAMMTTARQDVLKQDQSTPADPFDMGAGHVNPAGPTDAPNSMFNPGIVYDAGIFEYLGFLCDTESDWLVVALTGLPDGCEILATNVGIPIQSENLNYPSIGVSEVAGSKTITRTVTNVSDATLDLAANVEAPAGYDVTVTPSNLSIAAGDSASFEVTFDNVGGAPVGAWRFGSLTWEGDGFAARSPIAVAAAQLEAPTSLTGTGTSGETSFDVTFGYSGEYDAAAHGLAANVPITGSVTQDADQSFDPSDVGNGATAHQIVVGGSAVLRITLGTADLNPPNSGIDLDLYLYKDGAPVAISGAGSTDELIELILPQAGTYVLYVHGWQTTGITVGYSLNTWDVPIAADAGSLVVTAEPADAVLGATEPITVGWSGLGAGEYLGAVSHHDGDGLIGLTLVEVSAE